MIGAGTMGGGIAMCFANAGIPVTLIETRQEALERGYRHALNAVEERSAGSGSSVRRDRLGSGDED